MRKIYLAALSLILTISLQAMDWQLTSSLLALDWHLTHYISSNGRYFEEKVDQNILLTSNYRPDLSFTFWQKDLNKIDLQQIADFELALYDLNTTNNHDLDIELNGEMYRSWLRYSAEQYELRLGLQQLNFGTSTILRSLQWFDNIDPRDANNSTAGTYAFLFKRYFQNNTNLWIWLLKPDAPKFNSIIEYVSEDVEFGGRIQYPFQYCEAGYSIHHGNSNKFASETKMGLDLRWDMALGFWMESSLTIYNSDHGKYFSRLFTLGSDYTLGIGSGIYCLAEHLYYSNLEEELLEPADRSGASSLLLSYPINMFDNMKCIITYNWRSEAEYYYFSYNRSYDYLTIYLNFYLNPYQNDIPLQVLSEEGKSIELKLEAKF